jgi:hypothetical protein
MLLLLSLLACPSKKPIEAPSLGCGFSLVELPEFSNTGKSSKVSSIAGVSMLLGNQIDPLKAEMALPLYEGEEPLEDLRRAFGQLGLEAKLHYGHDVSGFIRAGIPVLSNISQSKADDLVVVVGALAQNCEQSDSFIGYNFSVERWGSISSELEPPVLLVGASEEDMQKRLEQSGLQVKSITDAADHDDEKSIEEFREERAQQPVKVSKGELAVNTIPWGFIFINGMRYSPWFQDSLPSGAYEISLVSHDGRFHEERIMVRPGQMTRYCWNFDLKEKCTR